MYRTSILATLIIACLGGPTFGQAWKFIVTCDSRGSDNGINATILSELADAIVAEDAAFVLVPGDLVSSGGTAGQFTTWKNTMQPVYNAGIGVYPVRGNHDKETSGYWETAFGADLPDNGPTGEIDRTYSFTYNNAFVVGLDNYTSSHRVNQTWLDSQFAANSQPHVFVMAHEPAFKAHHTDCLDDYPTNRNTFWASITDAGGRTYFAGHDHFYNHARIDDGDGNPDNDLHQYIVGTAGAPPYSGYSYNGNNAPYTPVNQHHELQYGYVVVDIDGLDVTMTWKHRTAPGVYTATADVFQYAADLPGDFNRDAMVEQIDLTLLLTHWGASSVPAEWSATFDGLVDQTELNDLLANWGAGISGASEPASADAVVPEPAMVGLLLFGLWIDRRTSASTRTA